MDFLVRGSRDRLHVRRVSGVVVGAQPSEAVAGATGANEPFVSIVMVVRNEEKVVARKMENLLALDYPEQNAEIVVVSDGSTDGTEAILRDYARNPRVHAMLNQLSRGKASGLNDALEVAHGEIVVFTDVRQTLEAQGLRLLVENFADPQVGCVSGELMLGDPAAGEKNRGMGLYWRIEKTDSRSGVSVGFGRGCDGRVLRSAAGAAAAHSAGDFSRRCVHPDAGGEGREARDLRAQGARLGFAGPGSRTRVCSQGAHLERQLPVAATAAVAVERERMQFVLSSSATSCFG